MTSTSSDASGRTAGKGASPPVSLLSRAWRSFRRDGPIAFLVTVVRHCVFDYRSYYLYEYPLLPPPAIRSRPLPDGFDECFIEGNEDADRVATERCDFRGLQPRARLAMDNGAVAFCLYHGREIAHVGWLATSEAAKRALEPLPFEIRFDQGEAWAGSVYTVPASRNRGLLTYSVVRRFGYLKDAGFGICRAAVERNNAASNHVQMHFEPRIYAVGRALKLFSWRWWSEHPTKPGDLPPELRGSRS